MRYVSFVVAIATLAVVGCTDPNYSGSGYSQGYLSPRLRLSVELSSELWLLSKRIRRLCGPLRLRIDGRLPQLQRSALRSAA